MAQRRMFSLKIIDTDLFLDMPASTQLLYFHLSLRADDDGFVSAPNKILRMVGCNNDDFKILIAKQLILPFESGVCVIKHWRVHNSIKKDRYTPTFYKFEKSSLVVENGIYNINDLEPKCIQSVSNSEPQVRLGKVILSDDKSSCSNKLQPVIDKWNSLNLQQIKFIRNNRLKILNARIKESSLKDVIQAIDNIENSKFLKGQNKNNWVITFDWFIKPNNFTKVLEGNFTDKEDRDGSTKQNNAESKGKWAGYKPQQPKTGDATTEDNDLI